MARRAGGQRPDVIFLDQLAAESELIGRRLILHVEDLIARTDELFGRAVALETPVHVQRIDAPRERHFIEPAVARSATYPLVQMDAVIEIDEAGQIVDPCPLNRLPGAEAVAHRRQSRAIRPDLRVTIHTNLGRRNSGKRTRLDGSVAVPAIDPIVGNMMFVTKRDRLSPRHSYFRDIGGAVESGYD